MSGDSGHQSAEPSNNLTASQLQANEHGGVEGHGGATGQAKGQFTSNGAIPPVMPWSAGAAALSASDQAFGVGAHDVEANATSPHTFSGPAKLRVTASALNVRSAPTTQDHKNVLGGLHHGEEIEAIDREGQWIAITYRGQRAYVHGAFVEAIPTKPPHAEHAEHDKPPIEAPPQPPPPTPHPTPTPHATPPPTTHTTTPPPTTHDTAPTPVVTKHDEAPVPVKAPHVDNADTKATSPPPAHNLFKTLAGNEVETTTPEEAHVLNAIRHDARRFDPAWLAHVQKDVLKVGDATGAMNTETLRAMMKHGASLSASSILDPEFLAKLDPGKPFMPAGPGVEHQARNPKANTPGDRAAQAVGYADYRSYRATFTKNVKFLGVDMAQGKSDGSAHPYLVARLRAAEAFLRGRHPGKKDDEIATAIQWSGKGGLSYDDKEGEVEATGSSHPHTMGLAIDIDVAQNPWIFATDNTPQMQWWKEWFETQFAKAARIFGGTPLSAKKMFEMSMNMSTEELHAHILQTSEAFAQYIELSKKLNKPGNEQAVIDVLMKQGHYSESEAKAELKDLKKVDEIFHHKTEEGSFGRHDAKSITNHSLELVVALRDAAGLDWGGTEMHVVQNGDFMHFDCRNDMGFGQATYDKNDVPHLQDHETEWLGTKTKHK